MHYSGAVIVIDNVPGTETNVEVMNIGNTQARPLSDYVFSFDKVRDTRFSTSREVMRHWQIKADVDQKRKEAEKQRKATVHNAANRDGAKNSRSYSEIKMTEKQEKHTKPIDVSQAAHRKFHIQQICEERNIATLVHFTRIENLQNILQEGLLSRSLLETGEQQFLFNDNDRVNGHKDAVCLSISFPNYQMFYRIRKQKEKTQEASDSQWIVLLLDAKVLWELECAFCQRNAAHKAVTSTLLKDRKRPKALKGMFEDFYDIKHQDLSIPQDYPTHPQAEVLVFDPISVQYIKAIHFWNADAQNQWLPSSTGTDYETACTDRHYFEPRRDYEVWRSANFNDEGIPLSYSADNEVDNDDDISFEDIPF